MLHTPPPPLPPAPPPAGAAATVEAYKAKLADLKSLASPMLHRVAESRERPTLVNDTEGFIASSRGLVGAWAISSPQVSGGHACVLVCGDRPRCGTG